MVEIAQLPAVNAALNTTSAILLLLGYRFIRQQNRTAHQICMLSAFFVSVCFLVSYLVYHAHAGTTRFQGTGLIRPVYFTILLSHTVLAAVVPVLALLTLYRAFRQQFDQHRRIARWTFPIWLYVSLTGVAIYWLLYHAYPSYSPWR
ncbi:MAG: DUF420 domain-containing protein [Candidatus Binatia bacterium]